MNKDNTNLITQAKAGIDRGFGLVGRGLSPADPISKALAGQAGRAISAANAVVLLSLNNHGREALPLLRALFGIAVDMRWMAAADRAERAAELLKEQEKAGWDTLWSDAKIRERAKGLEFSPAMMDQILSSCREHVRGSSAGVPWGYVFESPAQEVSPDQLVRMAAEAMGHVLKALDLHWGKFPGAEEIWNALKEREGLKRK